MFPPHPTTISAVQAAAARLRRVNGEEAYSIHAVRQEKTCMSILNARSMCFVSTKKIFLKKRHLLSLYSSVVDSPESRGERSGTRRKGVVTEGAAEGASRGGGRQLRRIQSIALSHRPTAVTHCWCGISRSRYESAERSGEAATDASSGQPKASSRLCGVHRREGGSDRLGQRRRRRRRQRCCCW